MVKETVEHSGVVDTMYEYAEKLATTLEWNGPLMVECKADADSRQVNLWSSTTLWGSLPLALAAGIDMPIFTYE